MKTIVWDIDDVLNDLTKAWLERCWLPSHTGCRVRYGDLRENPPHAVLGVGKAEYLESLDAFRLSGDADMMVPDERVMEWFQEYGTRFRHIALTARPRKTVSPSFAWVLRHFGEWFQTFSYVPAQRTGEPPGHPDRTKREFLSWLGKVDYFMDDSEDNTRQAESLGIETGLVAQPWNSSVLSLMDILNALVQKRTLI